MKKILSWLGTILFVPTFFLILCFFHVTQMLSLKLGGYQAHKKSVDYMAFWLMQGLRLLGGNLPDMKQPNLPTDRPLLIISNHQSMYDIPTMVWALRRHHAKFVSKIELAHGFPAVSYNLRHGGSVLIDRKDRNQSLTAMASFAEYIEKNCYAACIFPEGTRSRTGELKEFKSAGVMMMLKKMKNNPPIVVPVALNGYYLLEKYKFKPIPFGIDFSFKILEPIDSKEWAAQGKTHVDLLNEVENRIRKELGQAKTNEYVS